MIGKHDVRETRTFDRIRAHYEIEKELALRLRNSSKADRRILYSSLYDELFRRVPDHPQLARKVSDQKKGEAVRRQMSFIRRFLNNEAVFLEVGSGDCALSFEVAGLGLTVHAVDVSETITRQVKRPPNFALSISDGVSIPLPERSVDVAYSNQLMEHLHPDDAMEQLRNIYAALKEGGVYVLITPNRFNGPHDVSRYFENVATGLHLKEYTNREIIRILKTVGFSGIRPYIGARNSYVPLPGFLLTSLEQALELLPGAIKKPIANSRLMKLLLGIRIVARK